MIKFQLENKVAVPGTTFPQLQVYGKIVHPSRASNSKENDQSWSKFELGRDFMPILDTCKFEEVVIRTESAIPRTMSNMFFYHSRASNSKKTCTIWLKFKLVRDFIPVLIIRKFDPTSIENKQIPWGNLCPPPYFYFRC